jgi:hypothetical protein
MKVQLDYTFEQPIYLKNDVEQQIYYLHRIILAPKGRVILELFSPLGDLIEANEGYCSKEKVLIFDTDV